MWCPNCGVHRGPLSERRVRLDLWRNLLRWAIVTAAILLLYVGYALWGPDPYWTGWLALCAQRPVSSSACRSLFSSVSRIAARRTASWRSGGTTAARARRPRDEHGFQRRRDPRQQKAPSGPSHAVTGVSRPTLCRATGHRFGEFAHKHRMCGRPVSRPFVNDKQGRVAVSSRRGHHEQQCQPNEEGEHTGVDGESTAEVVTGWPYQARPSLAPHRCHDQPPVTAPSGASRREHRQERRRARWYIRLRHQAPAAGAGMPVTARRRSRPPSGRPATVSGAEPTRTERPVAQDARPRSGQSARMTMSRRGRGRSRCLSCCAPLA